MGKEESQRGHRLTFLLEKRLQDGGTLLL
jgi:hypothetical protein